jgi:hypothetical protein
VGGGECILSPVTQTRELLYRAGRVARATIRRDGLQPKFIGAFAGPASGPKWLVLVGIDRAIIASGLLTDTSPTKKATPTLLAGSSAGGWRALAMACPDPEAAHRELEDRYVGQVFGRGVTPAQISAAYHAMLSRLMSPSRTRHLLDAATLDVALHVARARGPTGASRQRVQAVAMVVAAGLNAVSPRMMRLFFSRFLLHTRPDRWRVDFDGKVVRLTADNLVPAALSTGTIPLYMHAVRELPGTSGGRFIDGGLTDYHLNQRYTSDEDGIVLFPHFQERIVPNWFDRYLPRRTPSESVIDNVLQVYPSPGFVAGLPGGRIPNRDDFIRLIDEPELRMRQWREAAAVSERLGEQFLDDLERGRIPDLVRGV